MGSNQFRYSWNAAENTLQLDYGSKDAENPSVIIGMKFSSAAFFEMAAMVKNQTNGLIQNVGLPGSLVFPVHSVDAAYLPFLLPGVKLRPQFFQSRRSAAEAYPSQLCFADFMAVETGGSLLSVYSVNSDDSIQPVSLGVFSEGAPAGTFIQGHQFETNIPSGASYSSPIVRIQVGGTVPEVLATYRTDNKLAEYPSIADKLGARWQMMARSPLVRADFQLFRRSFSDWTADLGKIRSPAIIHPVGFQTGGHDHSYPDLLPPNPSFGTTADFKQFTEKAAARNLAMMPHTNYTWWNPQSPTLVSLSPAQIKPLAAQNASGEPLYEVHGNQTEQNGGVVVSPSANSTRSRIDSAWTQWSQEAGIDTLFLDQIGGRKWLRDYNQAAASPTQYQDQWLSLVNTRPGMRFATEGGYDRLGQRFFAFFGSAIAGPSSQFSPAEVQWGVNSPANFLLGNGTWEPYPIATWLLHDKVLFYQHNLEIASYTSNPEVLSWNALFGYSQTHLWPGTPGANIDAGWADLAGAFQRTVSSRQAGLGLAAFERRQPNVAYSRFGDVETFVNWDVQTPYAADEGTVVPSGFLTRTADGSLTAGLFQDKFLGQSLSPGTHALVVERDSAVVTIRHPIGPATTLAVPQPAAWSSNEMKLATAVDRDDNVIGTFSQTVSDGKVLFSTSAIDGKTPSRFILQGASDVVLSDGASFQFGPIAPGEIVSIFGNSVGPTASQSLRLDGDGRISTELGGIRVSFNGTFSPLLFVSQGQVNAIVPYSAAAGDSVSVQITRDGTPVGSVTVPVVNAVPRFFTSNGEGKGQIAAVNDMGTINSPGNPVKRGGVISFYGTGGGLENVSAADGELANDASRTLRLPVAVTIGGRPAEVLYAGAAPGMAGVLQINVRVPVLLPEGESIPVHATVGGTPIQVGTTISIQ
jgi:uncharacterized protein (TIGR03437 family)